jgi:hypothetical protein
LEGVQSLKGVVDRVGDSTVSYQMHWKEGMETDSLYKVSLFGHVDSKPWEKLTIQGTHSPVVGNSIHF